MEIKSRLSVISLAVLMIVSQMQSTRGFQDKCNALSASYKDLCCMWDDERELLSIERGLVGKGYATLDEVYRCLAEIVQNSLSLTASIPRSCCGLLLFQSLERACGTVSNSTGET